MVCVTAVGSGVQGGGGEEESSMRDSGVLLSAVRGGRGEDGVGGAELNILPAVLGGAPHAPGVGVETKAPAITAGLLSTAVAPVLSNVSWPALLGGSVWVPEALATFNVLSGLHVLPRGCAGMMVTGRSFSCTSPRFFSLHFSP